MLAGVALLIVGALANSAVLIILGLVLRRQLQRLFRYPLMVFCGLIESGINDLYIFSLNCLFNIGYFLRPLINQQNDQMHLRVVFLYRLGNFL